MNTRKIENEKNDSVEYFSDWINDYLSLHGIDTFVFNPGASFRAIHESLVNKAASRIIMACHEEIAVAFAHGYYKASGRIICVLIHANVGLLHSSMALFNAWCDRIPLLCLVGNGPLASGKRRPWIDWIHTAHDVLSPVKGFCAFSATSFDQWGISNDLRRALRIVLSEERLGPAIIAVDVDAQESVIEENIRDLAQVDTRQQQLYISESFVSIVAQRLSQALRPLILVERAGRQAGFMKALENLSQALNINIPVVECGFYENSISHAKHNHWMRIENAKVAEPPDFILSFDVVDPKGYLKKIITDEAIDNDIFININTPGVDNKSWSADTGIDSPGLVMNGDIVEFISQVTEHVGTSKGIDTFIFNVDKEFTQLHFVIRSIYKSLKSLSINFRIVNGGSTNIDLAIRTIFPFEHESQYLGMNGGGGLGYGLPASLGAAMAIRDEGKDDIAISFLGDGDFLYSPSALWTASANRIPILLIVINNRKYFNSVEHAKIIAKMRQRDTNPEVATTFYDSDVDFVSLANSFNVKAKKIVPDTYSSIKDELENALFYIKENSMPYLLDVRV